MAIDSVDAGGKGKTKETHQRDKGGDPRAADAEDDARNDLDAGGRASGEVHRQSIEGRVGKGVHPVAGTSASNIDVARSRGPTCGNLWVTGYGQCGGQISDVTGRCERCGVPTRHERKEHRALTRFPQMADRISDQDPVPDGVRERVEDLPGSTNSDDAHEQEAARAILRRETSQEVFERYPNDDGTPWDPSALGAYSIVPPGLLSKQKTIQGEIDRLCQERFMRAGLVPRRN